MPTKTLAPSVSLSRRQTHEQPMSLIDRLIDSPAEWRHLIREANGGEQSLSSLSETQIKRQEVIHELVQTERHHCLTLALMRQFYLAGLRQLNEARTRHTSGDASNNQEPIDLERLFPALEELVQAHELFFAHLRLKLVESCQSAKRAPGELIGVVGPLGDLLREQFRLKRPSNEQSSAPGVSRSAANLQVAPSGSAVTLPFSAKCSGNTSNISFQTATITNTNGNGHKLLQAYAKFCGSHTDSSKYYKHLMRTDKGFKQFIEDCNKQRADCRQRGILECNLLVTQRLTKYPLLIEQLIKSSKDDPDEEAKLRQALQECKSLLDELNQHLARKESFERLLDIYAQFCPKSYTLYNGHLRFTKHDLLQHKRLRQLLHSDDQVRIWSATRRKLFRVLCLILDDIIVFIRIENPSNGGGSSSGPAMSNGAANNMASLAPSDFHQQGSHLWPLEAAVTENAAADHQHHHSLIGGSHQCALINVVASALHSATAQHLMHHGQQTALGGSGGHPEQRHQQQGINIRYYFANVDNKSSVISLGKLLIRDKAARDEAEPRTYLISSSPRQPEMYELAFVSRRHQANFVEKLKGCIEQHNKNVAAAVHLSLAGQPLELMSMDLEDVIHDDDEQEDVESNEEEDDLLLDNASTSEGCPDEETPDDLSRSINSDNNNQTAPFGSCNCDNPFPSAQDRLTPKMTTKTSNARRQRSRQRTRTVGELEFNIEQDIVEPSAESLDGATEEHSASFESSSSAAYMTPRAPYPGDSPEDKQTCGNSSQDTETIKNSLDSGSGPEGNEHIRSECNSESSDASQDDANDDRLASNESGLSERAKDSMDESSAPNKQRLRGARRRRPQRPRNTSNQSSSSSEAAHRQAIEMITAKAVAAAAAAANVGPADSTVRQPDEDDDDDEEFDSGRGHDDSSSTSSNSAHKTKTDTTEPEPKLVKGEELGPNLAPCNDTDTVETKTSSGFGTYSSATSSSSASSESGLRHKRATSAACTPAKCSQASSQCASSGKAAQMKLRKLSTVSSMSSQLKLLTRLRNTPQPQSSASPGDHSLISTATCCQSHNRCSMSAGTLQDATLSRQMRQQMRRSAFIPEQKLEELRDLQLQLEQDKKEWQAKFERMQEQLLNERHELDLARERLRQDQHEVANEREQLYRKLDLLKEKGILLSPSHKVIITTPELRHLEQQQQQQIHLSHQLQQSRSQIQFAPHSTSIQIVQQQPSQQRGQPLQYPNGRRVMSTNNQVPLHLRENIAPNHQQQAHRQSMGINGSQQISSKLPFMVSLLGEKASQRISSSQLHLI